MQRAEPELSTARRRACLREGPSGCRRSRPSLIALTTVSIVCVLTCGCDCLREYIHNGFKVGPNYATPPAPVAKDWIDAADARVRKEDDDLSQWWTVFNDPVLDSLI